MNPYHAVEPPGLEAFKEYLTARGCEVLAPTNEYEVLRFRAAGRTNVVYKKARSTTKTFVGNDIWDAMKSYAHSLPWRPPGDVVARRKSLGSHKRSVLHKALVARDGDECFYCGKAMGDDMTSEHLLSVTHGGHSRIHNLALAHEACNKEAGHLSVLEKIKLREKKRGYGPWRVE
jgi:5-methylcytosine-specific restriction endonuclease McrA